MTSSGSIVLAIFLRRGIFGSGRRHSCRNRSHLINPGDVELETNGSVKKCEFRTCRTFDVQNGFTTDQSVPSFRYSVPPDDCFSSAFVADDIIAFLSNARRKCESS